MNEGVTNAIQSIGSQKSLAQMLSVSQQVVSHWRTGKQKPSAHNALKIEKLTGIPREQIRPDIFGDV